MNDKFIKWITTSIKILGLIWFLKDLYMCSKSRKIDRNAHRKLQNIFAGLSILTSEIDLEISKIHS